MKVLNKINQETKNVLYKLKSNFSAIKNKVENNVPYVCQFSIPENAEPILRKELKTIDDLNWEVTGASSKEEYEKWAFTMCGMACTSMILDFYKGEKIKPVVLAEDALKNGVYEVEGEIISNMKYREFANWVDKYNLKAEVFTKLNIKGIQYALSNENLIIASVNPNIRGYDTAPLNQKGGHLVVVTGYNLKENTITINNPSGFRSTKTQVGHTLLVLDFLKYYAGRGIVLKNKV